MATSDKSKSNQNQTMTRLLALGIGAVLGYTYYRKRNQPLSAIKSKSNAPLAVDTSNVQLPKDIDKYFTVALTAAYEAGELINKFINDKESKSSSILTKENERDLVTEIDKKCEDIIVSKLKSAFPTHRIIGEESHEDLLNFNITNEPTWFIDPIDGTTNFVHGIPFCCVCIGLRVNKISILGIVHCPVLQETFHAILHRGSFIINHKTNQTMKLQTNRLKFNNDEMMKQAMFISQDMTDRSEKWVTSLNKRLYDLLYGKKIRAIRIVGSCAIDMCWVAMGRADVFFTGRNYKIGPKPWDFTAAEIIVSEAGGIACLPEGEMFDCTQGRVLCCNDIETAKYLINMGLYRRNDPDYK